jgi:hypothetical protein
LNRITFVIGGGDARKLKKLPPHCQLGENANAFKGGFRLWEDAGKKSNLFKKDQKSKDTN